MNSIFRCPSCKGPIGLVPGNRDVSCGCGHTMPVVDGIPLLVADRVGIDRQIQSAMESEKQAWFKDPQSTQWEGPYRHHVLKRKRYVESWLGKKTGAGKDGIVGLDLGCGDGANFFWLSEHIGELYGSDYNLLRLKRANAKGMAKTVFMADVTDYPTESESFDVIYFNHVLEHIPDDRKALGEVSRILRKNGIAVLGVPNEGAFFWQLAYRLSPDILKASDHVHFYKAAEIEGKCRAAGLTVLETHHIGWGVPHWTLDSKIRGFKAVDDALETVGRAFLKSQATSLYLILTKT